MYDDFEDLDILDDEEDELFEEKPRSRTFTIVAGILGVLIVFAIITVAAFLLFSDRDTGNNDVVATEDPAQVLADAQTATAQAQQAFISDSLTQTAEAVAAKAAATEEPTPTPEPTEDASPTQDAAATIQAAYTQAVALQTEQAAVATEADDALPDTGFADDLGLPGIIAFSALLFTVIVLVRRARTQNS